MSATRKKAAASRGRRYEPLDLDLRVRRSTAGLGLFANEPIAKGACVIEYVGPHLDAAKYQHSNSSYLFDVGGEIWIDGAPRWNTARYINHSCAPNCEPVIRDRRVFIFALRDIKPDEELSYNYGSEFFDAKIGENCKCTKCAPELYAKPKITTRNAPVKKPGAPTRPAAERKPDAPETKRKIVPKDTSLTSSSGAKFRAKTNGATKVQRSAKSATFKPSKRAAAGRGKSTTRASA
jgi:hypothetical protein